MQRVSSANAENAVHLFLYVSTVAKRAECRRHYDFSTRATMAPSKADADDLDDLDGMQAYFGAQLTL